ncbi:MAG: hypothetical protein ACQER9_02805 [Nanobdellota archaeon]
MTEKMPVFVKIDEYKEVLDVLNAIKEKVDEAKTVLNEVEELKEKEDNELESWKSSIDDIDNNINYINQTMFEPEN